MGEEPSGSVERPVDGHRMGREVINPTGRWDITANNEYETQIITFLNRYSISVNACRWQSHFFYMTGFIIKT